MIVFDLIAFVRAPVLVTYSREHIKWLIILKSAYASIITEMKTYFDVWIRFTEAMNAFEPTVRFFLLHTFL